MSDDKMEVLSESKNQLEKKVELQALTSKVKGVNDHLNALIQKKLRLDIEIKRVQQRLLKLRKHSKALAEECSSTYGVTPMAHETFILHETIQVQGDWDDLLTETAEVLARADLTLSEVSGLFNETTPSINTPKENQP